MISDRPCKVWEKLSFLPFFFSVFSSFFLSPFYVRLNHVSCFLLIHTSHCIKIHRIMSFKFFFKALLSSEFHSSFSEHIKECLRLVFLDFIWPIFIIIKTVKIPVDTLHLDIKIIIKGLQISKNGVVCNPRATIFIGRVPHHLLQQSTWQEQDS